MVRNGGEEEGGEEGGEEVDEEGGEEGVEEEVIDLPPERPARSNGRAPRGVGPGRSQGRPSFFVFPVA